MSQKILYQGAEAVITQNNNEIIKQRVKKSYRIPELDEKIRKLRTRSETKLLEKASKIVPIPKVIKSDEKTKEIIMEFIDGKKLSEHLDSFSLEKQKEILKVLGEEVAKLHDANIVHGDLTTSNMILVEHNSKNPELKRGDKNFPTIFLIDFGLGFISQKAEDKAVDIHLLKQALEAKHFRNWEILYEEFLKGYKNSKESNKVLERLKVVEKRGRYRH